MTEGTLSLLQQKSGSYDKPVNIDIAIGSELLTAVISAVKSDILCPFLIHYRPKRITKQSKEAKVRPFTVTPKYLSDAYSEIRDKVGVYNHLPKINRPRLHSLRALGIWLYTKAGYSDEYIMALAGHATERMKQHYTEGHEKVAAVRVDAGLSMDSVDLKNINWETGISKNLRLIINSEE